MLDSGTPPESSSWFGARWFRRGVNRRLLVLAICGMVALTTVTLVQRGPAATTSAGPSSTGVPQSGTRVPPSQTADDASGGGSDRNGGDTGIGRDGVPADPRAAIAGVLDARATAIRDGDRTAWLATLAAPTESLASGTESLASGTGAAAPGSTGPSASGTRASASGTGAAPTGTRASATGTRASATGTGASAGGSTGPSATGTERGRRFRVAQAQLFDRVRALHPASWNYRVTGGSPLPDARRAELGGTAWLADVHLQYQLTAGGPRVDRRQSLTVVRSAGDWLIADDTDGATGRDVWDLAPITQAGSARCLVVGARARRQQVEQLAAECGRSAATVDTAWGREWPRRTVLTVPADRHQLAVLLGRVPDSGARTGDSAGTGSSAGTGAAAGTTESTDDTATAGLDQTAAVTIGPSDGPADGVLINGTAFDTLSAVGRRVVLTHELVHVATRATGSGSAPTWLSEGYADHVAYADTGLTAEQIAGDALVAVRAGRVPTGLPGPDDFNAAGDQAAAAYGQSWVAVGLIAEKVHDGPGLASFYRQASGSGGVDTALTTIGLGGTPGFVGLWQARLRALAR